MGPNPTDKTWLLRGRVAAFRFSFSPAAVFLLLVMKSLLSEDSGKLVVVAEDTGYQSNNDNNNDDNNNNDDDDDGRPDYVHRLEWQSAASDERSLSKKIASIAFGSCHSRKKFEKDPPDESVWQVIAQSASPSLFVWTGDVVYPSHDDDNVTSDLEKEYQALVDPQSPMGYASFAAQTLIHGVWDDHDYGTNDAGSEIPLDEQRQRRSLFWQYVLPHLSPPPRQAARQGMYYSLQLQGEDHSEQSIRIILLDTRWSRDWHCLPSLSSTSLFHRLGIPSFGTALLSAITRWWTAAWNLPQWGLCYSRGNYRRVLSEEQWKWFQQQLQASSLDSLVIVVSSIQVLTTNPAVESWGHFPEERQRLLQLLQHHRQATGRSILIWSGDVHHAEIMPLLQGDSDDKGIMEVTSSGLTHSCQESHGWMCRAVLDTFDAHPRHGYYTGRNFGVLTVTSDWDQFHVNVHDARNGTVVLSTVLAAEKPTTISNVTHPECLDGHLKNWLWRQTKQHGLVAATTLLVLVLSYYRMRPRRTPPPSS